MQDFKDHMNIALSGKTLYAIIAYLKKHNSNTHDLSRFVEDAVIWRMLDREMALNNARDGEDVQLFSQLPYDGSSER